MRSGSIGQITGISLRKRLKSSFKKLAAPILLDLPPHGWRRRVLDLDPMHRTVIPAGALLALLERHLFHHQHKLQGHSHVSRNGTAACSVIK